MLFKKNFQKETKMNTPELSQWESDWFNVYPTYDAYMLAVDQQLEMYLGLGHDHLPDFMWMDAYEEKVLPNDVAKEYIKSQNPMY